MPLTNEPATLSSQSSTLRRCPGAPGSAPPRLAAGAAPIAPRPRTRAAAPLRETHASKRAPARPYDRQRDLGPLLPLWPHEIADETPAGRARLLAKLRRALREERRRALAGDWTYNLTRHAGLWRAWQHERDRAPSLMRD